MKILYSILAILFLSFNGYCLTNTSTIYIHPCVRVYNISSQYLFTLSGTGNYNVTRIVTSSSNINLNSTGNCVNTIFVSDQGAQKEYSSNSKSFPLGLNFTNQIFYYPDDTLYTKISNEVTYYGYPKVGDWIKVETYIYNTILNSFESFISIYTFTSEYNLNVSCELSQPVTAQNKITLSNGFKGIIGFKTNLLGVLKSNVEEESLISSEIDKKNVSSENQIMHSSTNFGISPNPVKNSLNVSLLEELSTIEIYSLTGRKMYSQNVNRDELEIDVSSFPIGIYILKATSPTISKTIKFSKE